MAIKQTAHIIRGLRKDFSDSKQPKEYAIDAKNIRITNREDSSLLSITNEKGTQEVTLNDTISGNYLGHTTINDILVLFTKDKSTNYIYKINLSNKDTKTLFEGKLSDESIDHIEALGVYESEDIQKVYWVDGVSQPRMINIKDENKRTNVKEFDFIQELQLKETISVEKSYSSGSFNSGVIQYAFNYYNKNGQESNIVEVTPINYISYEDRGAAPNDYVSNSFKITINNIDTNFDYLRLYSIHRTALDAIPSVKLVIDLKINKDTTTLTYIDTGIIGETVDPSELLFKGGEYIIPKTLAQKDGTLFLGSIKLANKGKNDIQKNILENELVTITATRENYKTIYMPGSGEYYYKNINQLNKDINKFSIFKYGEWYRLGIQFQNNLGKWEDPLFLKDFKMGLPLETQKINAEEVHAPIIQGTLDLQSLQSEIENNKYIKVRPVIVYPSIYDRNILCQGILCPTVFNLADRYNNVVTNQSSWFTRPNSPYDIDKIHNPGDGNALKNSTTLGYVDIIPNPNYTEENTTEASPLSIASNSRGYDFIVGENTFSQSFLKYGTYARFKHNEELGISEPHNKDVIDRETEFKDGYNAEFPAKNVGITTDSSEVSLDNLFNEGKSSFFVDQSVVTFHSPDLEFDNTLDNLDFSNYKLRVVGIVPITGANSDIDITTSTSPLPFNSNSDIVEFPAGFVKYTTGSYNKFSGKSAWIPKLGATSNMGWKSLINGPWWLDEIYELETREPLDYNTLNLATGFVIFPWHPSGSLNNDTTNNSSDLLTKILYNSKFSHNTFYLSELEYKDIAISDCKIWKNQSTSITLNSPKNYPFANIKYKGDIVDGVISFSSKYAPYLIRSQYRASNISNSEIIKMWESIYTDLTTIIAGIKFPLTSDEGILNRSNPIRIAYKSSPHAVLSLENIEEDGKTYQNILPTIDSSHPYNLNNFKREAINRQEETLENGTSYLWDIKNKNIRGVKQSVLNIDFTNFNDSTAFYASLDYGWLWLAELYRDDVINRFGGDYDKANNLWYPAGESVRIPEDKNKLTIYWTTGDTFYQRYDHLKTMPQSTDNENSITEIVSFMCETRVNIDGRYDRNRGTDNIVSNSNNFNLFNDVYNQKNTFFNYRIIDKDIADNTEFPNTIVWSKQKFAGADVDAWTNINMSSSLDLDGTKGEVTKLVSFKNEIFSFQPEAINHILFNSRVQIPTSDGVPIELTNAYKVDGARQLSSVGSSNPLAIKSTDRGIYYMDNITKGIYVFNGQQSESLSDKLGMSSWVKKQDIDSYKVNYDKINQDIYFINNDNCLSYSEKLGEFESFFDYNNSEIFNVKDGTYAIKSNKLYKLFEGNYNRFFEYDSKPFWVTFTHNENPFNDKIYNTLEFRADTYNYITKDEKGNDITPYWDLSNNSAFNNIIVENEYQLGSENLDFKRYTPSNLKRKFRIWRANIPRDNKNKRDRIRNTWTNITLKASNPSNTKTELHDLIVNYSM